MDPPAYTPPQEQSSTARRSIQDLRAQIVANGSIMRPKNNGNRDSSDHIEVILAKTPAARAASNGSPNTHWDEKQTLALMRGSSGAQQPISTTLVPPDLSASTGSVQGGRHYGVLIKRSHLGDIKIILKGEPKETVEEALEWMLERTEMLVHDLVVRRGRSADDGCCIM